MLVYKGRDIALNHKKSLVCDICQTKDSMMHVVEENKSLYYCHKCFEVIRHSIVFPNENTLN